MAEEIPLFFFFFFFFGNALQKMNEYEEKRRVVYYCIIGRDCFDLDREGLEKEKYWF